MAAQASAQQLSLKQFGQDEGLGNLTVTALAQDPAGYLWVGTESGLFRFNGATFRRYGTAQGLEDGDVTALFAGRAAGTWVGTYENFYRIDGERLTRVLYEGKPIAVWPGQVTAETADKEVLLVTEGRLLAVARHGGGTSVRNYFTPEQIRVRPELADLAGRIAEGVRSRSQHGRDAALPDDDQASPPPQSGSLN